MSANGKILYVGGTARPIALDLVLEGQGYQISTASNVNHALRVLEAGDFEAVVVQQELLDLDREKWRQLTALDPRMPLLGIHVR